MPALPLTPRDSLSSVSHTFSNWNNCMTKVYCKWPAIAGIILGSVLALSLLWCFLSCLCCGGTCPGYSRHRRRRRRSRGSKSRDEGVRYQRAPQGNAPVPGPGYEGWDSGKGFEKGDGDRLPMMPSWENARERRANDGVEMERLGDTYPPHAHDPQETGYRGAAPEQGYAGPGVQMQAPLAANNGYGDWRNSTYAPSGSTRYEPTVYEPPQEMGRTYKAPEVAVGRKPVRDTWRDV